MYFFVCKSRILANGPLSRIVYSSEANVMQCLSLFAFQAILFYVPRWLWKNWEAGKIAALRMDLNLGIISEVEKKLKKKLLIEYMYTNLKHHNFWAYRYFFCELLSLINVGGKSQIILKFGSKLWHCFEQTTFSDPDSSLDLYTKYIIF